MIKNIFKIIIISLLLGVAIFASQEKISWRKTFFKEKEKTSVSVPRIETLTLADTIMLHQNDLNIFVDTRIKRYFDYAHIPGAVNIPYNQLDKIHPEILEKLKASPNIVVYCVSTSCGVSYRSARKLMTHGLNNVKIYTGGWGEWKSCKLPVGKSVVR